MSGTGHRNHEIPWREPCRIISSGVDSVGLVPVEAGQHLLRGEQLKERAFPLRRNYFVTRCLVGVTAVGAACEIENVSHVFQPAARLAASNSP